MTDTLVSLEADFPWRDANSLPSGRFVLTRITHCTNPRRVKLVFARALEDGVKLASGGELSFDWSVTGWVDQDIEICFQPAAAVQAAIAPLAWTELKPGHWYAPDGLGGEYSFTEGRDLVRFEAEASAAFFARGKPRERAQAHHEDRLRGRIANGKACG